MKSKKLPVLWIGNPAESLGDDVIDEHPWIADEFDRKHFAGRWPIEPYIPAARVREKIAELEHFLSGLKPTTGPNGLEDDIRSAIEGYQSLIADVEDDGQAK